jgi:hypothetical protein
MVNERPGVSTSGALFMALLVMYIHVNQKNNNMSDYSIYDLIGKRVKLIEMFEDINPVESGTEGIVTGVGGDVINVNWDNGRILGMIWELDRFEVIG